MIAYPGAGQGLACLLFFDALPAREDWQRNLSSYEPDIGTLMAAVGKTLWHQSQESTDCRWVRLMAIAAAGKMYLNPKLRDVGDQLQNYPNQFDQSSVRPSIRSIEGSLDGLSPPDPAWAKAFWHEAWENTPCAEIVQQPTQPKFGEVTTWQLVQELQEKLIEHWYETHETTRNRPASRCRVRHGILCAQNTRRDDGDR